jgi:predicted ATPase
MTIPQGGRPVIERLTIRNYRVLHDVTLEGLTPLTVLFGPNGSGKSTVFDVFAFLNEAFTLAVSTLGQLSRHPRVSALRRFISGWYLSYVSADNSRSLPEAGPQQRLSQTGDNLPNVVQYLQEQYPVRLERLFNILGSRVPNLERIEPEAPVDGRLLLRLKDKSFEEPILAKFTSDGTLKMLAYLTALHDPDPPAIVGIEEPENQLHPRLFPLLAEEVREAAGRSQMLVTTHSPYFADALRPRELWVLYRESDGFSRAQRASSLPQVVAMVDNGAQLGSLWMEGYFDVGDPLRGLGSSV